MYSVESRVYCIKIIDELPHDLGFLPDLRPWKINLRKFITTSNFSKAIECELHPCINTTTVC